MTATAICYYTVVCPLLFLIGWSLDRALFTAGDTLVFQKLSWHGNRRRTCSASNICFPPKHGVWKAYLGTWHKIWQNFRDKSAARLQNHPAKTHDFKELCTSLEVEKPFLVDGTWYRTIGRIRGPLSPTQLLSEIIKFSYDTKTKIYIKGIGTHISI